MNLLVTFEVPPTVRAKIEARSRATFVPAKVIEDPRLLADASAGVDAVMITVTNSISASVFDAFSPSVRAIATYSAGLEHIDLCSAFSHGITILNTPGVLTDAVAEIAIFLMLGAARRATEAISLIRSRKWLGWTPTQLLGTQLSKKRLGVFGMGRIGQATALRGAAFGLEVHALEGRSSPACRLPAVHWHSTAEDLLAHSDVLLIACRVTPETKGFLNAERIELLPKASIVVNVARGAVIDDDALVDALASGRVAAAGLDVFANEPVFDTRYLNLPNVFMLPHIGSSTLEAREQMATILLDGLEVLFAGGRPTNAVD